MKVMIRPSGQYCFGYAHPYSVDSVFHDSILSVMMNNSPSFGGIISVEAGIYLSWARNVIAERFMDSGLQYLLSVDADMDFKPDLFEALVRHADENTIVGGLYYSFNRRNRQTSALMLGADLKPIDDWEKGSVIEVGAMGTGCMLLPRTVFEKVPKPWFHYREDKESHYGEDYSWCIKAREHGVRCVVDTSVNPLHAKGILIGEGDVRKKVKP